MRQTINVTGFLLLSAILAASGARPASACDADHLCGSRLCDWEDFDDNGLDDTSNTPISGATEVCKTCSVSGGICITNTNCPSGETCVADGVVTICGGPGADNLTWTGMSNSQAYNVCGFSGSDVIYLSHYSAWATFSPVLVDGGDGDDTITTISYAASTATGYTIYGGTGTDRIVGSGIKDTIVAGQQVTPGNWTAHLGGDDYIDVGNGDDTITGSGRFVIFGYSLGGNNTLRGGQGNDIINGFNGRDAIDGGPGTDTISFAEASDQNPGLGFVTGALLCGGDGTDTITASGPGHVCIDGGVESSGGNDSCSYTFNVSPARSATAFDVGTVGNCTSNFLPVPCGCD